MSATKIFIRLFFSRQKSPPLPF